MPIRLRTATGAAHALLRVPVCAGLMARALAGLAALSLVVGSVAAEPGDGQDKARKDRSRRQQRAEQPAVPQMVTPDFRYTHTRNGKPLFRISARKGEMYSNSDLVLTGVEEIVLYGADGRNSHLSADFGHWHSQAGDFEVWGNVQGTVQTDQKELGGDLRFETEKLVYKDSWKAVVTMKPVKLETASVTTTGVGLNYNLLSQKLVISQSVVTTMTLNDPRNPGVVQVVAGHLELEPAQKTAVYTEEPVLTLDQNRLAGEKMSFYLAEAEERLEVEGQVRGSFHVEQRPDGSFAPGSGPPVSVASQRAVFHRPSRTATFQDTVAVDREGERLTCNRMVLLLNQNGHDVESALAEDNVEVLRTTGRARGGQLLYRYATDEGLLSRNPSVLLPDGELTAQLIHFRKDGSIVGEREVRLRHRPQAAAAPDPGASALDIGDGPVDIVADRLNYAPSSGFVVFEDRVRVLRPGSRLESRKLTLQTPDGSHFQSLLAEQDVRLFSEERFLSGDRLDYDITTRKAALNGNPALARTRDDVVTAQVLTFSGSGTDKEYSARGTVSIELQPKAETSRRKPPVRTPQPTRATCGRAHINDGAGRIELAEEVHVDKPDDAMKLRADEVDLYLGKDRKVSQMIARGGVQIDQAQGHASGDVARYREDRRQLEVEGQAVVIEQSGIQSYPQRAVLHLDTKKVDLIGRQERVRTNVPVNPEKP
jgi:LPS export ABC transporter protein LptC